MSFAEPIHNADLRVLFFVRQDLFDLPGGDTIQVLNTAKGLRARGAAITISSDVDIDLTPFHCIHLWHLERVHETYRYMLRATAAGKPIALSPIYWPTDGKPRKALTRASPYAHCIREDLKNVVRWLHARTRMERQSAALAFTRGWIRCRREILDAADVVMPNSLAEAEIIAREAGSRKLFVVTPNVVDLVACDKQLAACGNPARAGVLCVGHFDPRKNQLLLIKSLRGSDIQVTFVGEPRRMHRAYYNQCRRADNGKHRFLGLLKYGEVLALMRQAHVHVCPSRYETPGLVNLEAAVMGCSLVVPDCPPVREYFGTGATFFRVNDAAALRDAIETAIKARPPAEMARWVRSQYGLDNLAERTLHAYQMILSPTPEL
jgi:glycosyltransferase involved in cell wall biosynthesis